MKCMCCAVLPAWEGPHLSAAQQLHSPEVFIICPSPRPAGPQPRALSSAPARARLCTRPLQPQTTHVQFSRHQQGGGGSSRRLEAAPPAAALLPPPPPLPSRT